MGINVKLKNFLSFLLRIFLSVGLLWFIFSRIDIDKTKEILFSADIKFILYSFLAFILINFILLIRWLIFIRAFDIKVPLKSIIRYFYIGLFGNLFLPSSIGGDLIKAYGVCKETNNKARVVASVLLDRLSGFVSIVIISVFAFTFGYGFIEDRSLLFPIIIMASGLFFIAIVLFNETVYSFFCRVFDKFPKIKNSMMQLHYDIALLNSKKKEGLKAIMMSCFSQIIFAFTFYLNAKALHQDVGIIYFLIFVPLLCVAASVPSIGGLGVREAGAAYLFAKAGLDSGVSVSLSLISFLFMVLVGLTGGVIYVTLSSGRIQSDSSNASAEQKFTA